MRAAELESLTAAHPLRERLHAQLIRALAQAGRGAEALAAYQRSRGVLADSFGSDPGPRLQEAHLAAHQLGCWPLVSALR